MTIAAPAPRLLAGLLGLFLLVPGMAAAEVRAWLDRDRIELGETATLNIEADGAARPDYGPLEDDFRIEQQTSRQSFEREGGRIASRMLHAVALRPLRAGRLVVPALVVGSERTAPLVLDVAEASPARARAGAPAFIEAEVDDPRPYVQQAVGLRLRLYYAPPLLSGQLDQPTPDGAALRREGNDLQYTRDIGGRRYQVVERRFVLVPERSGRLELPQARFQGRAASGGWLDDLFGDGRRTITAEGPALALEVRPVPDAATRPWRPLHGLELRWLEQPAALRAGDAATIELELVADGATVAQLEPPTLTADQGAQVFPEPPQYDETLEDGRPRVRMVRRFSVLPAREGRLRVEGPRLDWWDVRGDQARVATLPPLEFDVAPGAAHGSASGATLEEDGTWVRVPGVQGEVRAWALAAVGFAVLWLLTLAWGLRRGERGGAVAPGGGHAGGGVDPTSPARRPGPGPALRRALDAGDLGEIADALRALRAPPARDLESLAGMLASGAQRDAIAALQRARWGRDTEAAGEARALVRAAFARGPEWTSPRDGDDGPLPPLYPR